MRKSVSAIFVHNQKMFFITRQNYLSVFPGYTAFPGGKVDKNENQDSFDHELIKKYEPELIHALSRECKEEINFDLIEALDIGDILDIQMIGIAVTPEFNPYRFKNYFFKIELDSEIDFDVDENEAVHSGWIKPSELIEKYNQSELLAVPPTVGIIKTLCDDINYKNELDLSLDYKPDNEVPMIQSIYGVKQFLPLSNTFPPANRTNCFLIGDNGRSILVDPSPKNKDEYKKLMTSLKPFSVDEVFITHHHPDHHEYSIEMAQDLNVPIGLSNWTFTQIKKKWSEDYFQDREVKFYKEGDVITSVNNVDITVYEVPGHDEGQLGLAPTNMNWFLVGDLIQTVGTVVIGGEEGDMSKYFTSLQKVINLKPKFIIPSHGISLGGTNKLEMTLKHRKMRESQIEDLCSDGKTKDEILSIIYEGLDERLHKYAMATIDAHLKKLKIDIN
ncbi:MAG: MBL fold metallo-hydrolase [Bacteriovoracaceae bacterium]|nr:MBL fold metallo-hydrolase [Bacteriovoracaceae bacterium]